MIGSISLMHIDDSERVGEIGYWVADFARGQRVARRAIEVLSAWARSEPGVVRFTLRIDRENVSSIAAALAAGAQPTYSKTRRGRTVPGDHSSPLLCP